MPAPIVRPGAAAEADRARGGRAEPDQPAERLPVPSALPLRKICKEIEPPLVDYGNGHLAACHHP
jgi:hypothetical protein